jgi:sphingolipid delta-4 desaturase
MSLDYICVSYPEPHAARGRKILAAHPELRALAGPEASSAVWTVVLVAAQLAIASLVGDRRWYIWLPCAYVVGATIDHALWALIHETAHNLVFRWRTGNRLVSLAANIPLVFPGAIPFCKYHLLHHRHMGDMDFDAGIPGPVESRVIGQSGLKKGLWLAGTFLVQGVIRPRRITRIRMIDTWTVVNFVFQIACLALIARVLGTGALTYLVASSIMAIGFHPLGARWVQEHFALVPGQETYSYYGPLNRVSFNVGYHAEHHDIVTIPWSRLPIVRRTAPEFYDGMHSYGSWTALLVRFVRDRNITLFSYIVRPSGSTRPDRTSTPIAG